jgi:hypothetical protein
MSSSDEIGLAVCVSKPARNACSLFRVACVDVVDDAEGSQVGQLQL